MILFQPLIRKIFSHTVFKYLVSGGTAAFVQIAGLYILHRHLGLQYVGASTIAFIAAVIVSFSLQKFWTFNDYQHEVIRKQFFIFFVVGLINLATNALLMYIFVTGLGIWYLDAQVLTSGLVAVWSFFIYRAFIFKNHPTGPFLAQ